MNPAVITRREALRLLIASMGALFVAGGEADAEPTLAWLRNLHPNPKAAATLGRAWLVQMKRSSGLRPGRESLVTSLCGTDSCSPAESSRDALLAHLSQKHRQDFASGRVYRVKGWILSATEVQLYALIALESKKPR